MPVLSTELVLKMSLPLSLTHTHPHVHTPRESGRELAALTVVVLHSLSSPA